MVSTLLWILGQWSPQSLKLSHFEFIPQQFCLGTFEKVTAQSPVERLRIILLIGDKCLHISRLGQRQCRGKHSSSHQLFASFSREKSFVQSDSLVNFGVLLQCTIRQFVESRVPSFMYILPVIHCVLCQTVNMFLGYSYMTATGTWYIWDKHFYNDLFPWIINVVDVVFFDNENLKWCCTLVSFVLWIFNMSNVLSVYELIISIFFTYLGDSVQISNLLNFGHYFCFCWIISLSSHNHPSSFATFLNILHLLLRVFC